MVAVEYDEMPGCPLKTLSSDKTAQGTRNQGNQGSRDSRHQEEHGQEDQGNGDTRRSRDKRTRERHISHACTVGTVADIYVRLHTETTTYPQLA